MSAREHVEFESAYLLHARPYRESSRIIDVLTRYHGRVSLVAPFANLLAVPWFSLFVVPPALAGVAILYDTSKILRDFPEDRYVGAALQLFASVALMFWYVLRLTSRD